MIKKFFIHFVFCLIDLSRPLVSQGFSFKFFFSSGTSVRCMKVYCVSKYVDKV